MHEDPRAELADIASSLRAYLEIQAQSGATGVPRGTPPAPRKREPSPQSEAFAAPAVPTPKSSLPKPVRSLDVLAQEVSSCTKCSLHQTRTNTVFFRGNPSARLCFVGEAPGEDEDKQGKPFVGRAGQLLDKMIVAMGLDPDRDVYVCNILKCRPPGNRRPTPEETETCIPYLHDQLANVKPQVMVALGNTAASALLGTKLGITKLRGEWKLYKGTTLVMPTYHPSYLLRPTATQAQAKREAWEDLQKVIKQLGLPVPARR
jgi:DNA polymerase